MRMTRATEARFLTASGEAMDGKGEEEREVRAWWTWGIRGLGGETMLNGPTANYRIVLGECAPRQQCKIPSNVE